MKNIDIQEILDTTAKFLKKEVKSISFSFYGYSKKKMKKSMFFHFKIENFSC